MRVRVPFFCIHFLLTLLVLPQKMSGYVGGMAQESEQVGCYSAEVVGVVLGDFMTSLWIQI